MKRRDALKAVAVAAAGSVLPTAVAEEKKEKTPEKKSNIIAMVMYPQFTTLDLIGPHQVFSMLEGYRVHLVAKDKNPVTTDSGVTIIPTMTFEDCPKDLAVLCLPGGTGGTLKAMNDPGLLTFLKERSETTQYITSVCTGSLILGAAGLLEGYKATCHWVVHDVLKELGAIPVEERVVIDRNRLTGGGVTAGIDFGLTLAAKLKGEQYAKSVQLLMEYAPKPPFNTGSPKDAGEEMTGHLRKMFTRFHQETEAAAKKAKQGWGK